MVGGRSFAERFLLMVFTRGYTSKVRFHLFILIGLVVIGCAFAGLACAKNVASSTESRPCMVGVHGEKARIRPETSRLTCVKLGSIVSVLSGAVGTQTVTIRATAENSRTQQWVCRIYPRSKFPREVTCHYGARHFEVEGIS